MPVTFVGAGALADATWPNVSGSQNTSVPIHASTTTGDYMLLFAWNRRDVPLTGPGSGWVEVFNEFGTPGDPAGQTIGIFEKFHDGSEAEPTITWGTGAGPRNAFILSYRGVDPSDPIDQMPAGLSANASQANIGPIAGFTPSSTVGAVIVFGGRSDDWTSVATLTGESLTWAEIVEEDSTAGNDGGFVLDHALDWTSGAIAAKTFVVTGGAANLGAGLMFGLNNVASGTDYDEEVDDTASVTDAISKAPRKNIAEAPTVTDAVTKAPRKTIPEAPTVTDAISKATGKALADSAGVTDAQTKALNKGLADSVGVTDEVEVEFQAEREFDEDLGVTDEVTREWEAEREFDDDAEVTDAVTKDVDKSLADTAEATDAISLDPGKAVADTAEVTDAISIDPGKVVADSVSVTDEVEVQWDAFRTFDEGLGVTDEITIDHVQAGTGELEFNEQAFVTDSFDRLWQAVRDFDEELGVTDSVSKHIHLLIEDELSVGDAIQKAARVTIAETMGVSDSQVKVVGKGLTENLGVADLLTRQANYLREFDETLTIEDFIDAGLVFDATYPGGGSGDYPTPGASGYPADDDSEYVEAADVSDREADYG